MAPKKSSASKKEAEQLQGNDVCMMLHTALRKICDSPPTTSVYNLVHLICAFNFTPRKFDPWRYYGEQVALLINEGADPNEAVRRAHGRIDDFLTNLSEAKQKGETIPDNAQTAAYTLKSALRCFSKDDWLGMAAYLHEEDED